MLATASFAASGFVPVTVTIATTEDVVTTQDVTLAFPFAVKLWGVTRTQTGLLLELERAAADDDGCDMPLALSLPREGVDWKITQDAGPVVRLAVTEEGSY